MPLTEEEQNKVKELLSSDNGKLLQAWKDINVSQALKTYAEKNPTLPDAGKKLEQLKAGTESKIKQLEMKTVVMKKCFEKGIDYDSIEKLGISFEDAASVDTKLALLQKDIELKKVNDFNQLIVSTSPKPGTGNGIDSNSNYGIDPKTWNRLEHDVRAAIALEHSKKH